MSVLASRRDDGDFNRDRVDRETLETRRRRLVDLPWTLLDERHGVGVVPVEAPGANDGAVGDVAVVTAAGAAVGVWVGDCAPIVVAVADGRFAVVHAGWRGLAAGIVDVALDTLGVHDVAGGRAAGATAVLGPCIGPCCYEFGRADLARVAAGAGIPAEVVHGRTRGGATALDVPATVRLALARRGVPLDWLGPCTGCSPDHFSHRARAETERQVLVAWRQAAGPR